MKKVIFTALMSLFLCTTIDAQILRTDELEDYAKEKYGENGLMQLKILVSNSSWTKTTV